MDVGWEVGGDGGGVGRRGGGEGQEGEETVVEVGAFEDEVDEGVEGVPDEEEADFFGGGVGGEVIDGEGVGG